MHIHHAKTEQGAPHTHGILIRQAGLYNLAVGLLLRGADGRALDLAGVAPGCRCWMGVEEAVQHLAERAPERRLHGGEVVRIGRRRDFAELAGALAQQIEGVGAPLCAST